MTFSPHRTDPGTGFGQMQVSSWQGANLYEVPLTPAGGGIFTPGTAVLFVTLPQQGTGGIQYVPSGPLVTAARSKTQSAEASANAGSTRSANHALKKAARKMIDFGHRLRSLRSRKNIPAATRTGLVTQSQPILDDLKALRKQL